MQRYGIAALQLLQGRKTLNFIFPSMNSEDKLCFKKKIKLRCEEIIRGRISVAEHAMKQAQESANSDEKSSAGDKHETGRAMGQIDREMNERQLKEAKRELEIIHAISTD